MKYTYDTFVCTLYTCFTLSIYGEHIFLMHELALKESCQRFELKKIKIRMHLPLQIFFFFSTNTDEPCTTNMFLLLWVDRYSAANIICLLQDAKCIYSNRPTLSRTHDIIKISKHHDTFQGFQQMYLTFIIKSCETKNCHVLSLALPECWNWVKYGHSPREVNIWAHELWWKFENTQIESSTSALTDRAKITWISPRYANCHQKSVKSRSKKLLSSARPRFVWGKGEKEQKPENLAFQVPRTTLLRDYKSECIH